MALHPLPGRRTPLVFLLALAAFTALPRAAFSQEEEEWQLFMKVAPAANEVALDPINLRPNSSTGQLIYLVKDANTLSNARVTLVQDGRVLAEAAIKELGKAKDGSKVRCQLLFAPLKGGADKVEVKGPPFKLKIRVKAGENLTEKDLPVRIREPKEFVSVTSATYENNRLQFKVKLNKAVGLSDCPVKLVLGPEFLPPSSATLEQTLTQPAQEVTLSATGLKLRNNVPEGRASLTVDGYKRAFDYAVDLSSNPELLPHDKKIGALIRAPRYARATDKLKVAFELDGPLDAPYRVQVGLDTDGSRENFADARNFTGLREQKLELSFKDGALLWKTTVLDWESDFNVEGVLNKAIWFKLQVLKQIDNAFTPAELALPTVADPGLALHVPDPSSPKKPLFVFAKVILDDSPVNVEFKDWKEEWIRGTPLRIQAMSGKRDQDRQSPIDEVVFFKGKYPADGKITKDMMLGKAKLIDADANLWETEFTPRTKDDAMDVSVLFKTPIGIVGKQTATLHLIDPPPAVVGPAGKPAAKLAKIRGTVMHGDLAKPDLSVGLVDAKGLKSVVKTDASGVYEFKDVPPGTYIVYSGTNYPKTSGQTTVTVASGQELVDNVGISLLATNKAK